MLYYCIYIVATCGFILMQTFTIRVIKIISTLYLCIYTTSAFSQQLYGGKISFVGAIVTPPCQVKIIDINKNSFSTDRSIQHQCVPIDSINKKNIYKTSTTIKKSLIGHEVIITYK